MSGVMAAQSASTASDTRRNPAAPPQLRLVGTDRLLHQAWAAGGRRHAEFEAVASVDSESKAK